MKKKIILVMVLSFSLFMFGCSSNEKIAEKSIDMIENSMFTMTNKNGSVKYLMTSGYEFLLYKSGKISISREDGSNLIRVYEDSGWTKRASKEDKQNIKNILGID